MAKKSVKGDYPPPRPTSDLVGVCYEESEAPLSGHRFVALCQQYGIGKVRLFKPNSDILQSLRGTNIEVMLCVPDELLPSFVDISGSAASWVSDNVAPYLESHNEVKFKYIVVGNKVSPSNPDPVVVGYANILVRAMEKVCAAIYEKLPSFVDQIKVTTVLDTAVDPPIGGTFGNAEFVALLSNIVSFLTQHYKKLPILVDVQSYDFYCKTPVTPPVSEIFKLILEMEKSAVARATKNAPLDVIVSATGWPSAGGPHANHKNAEIYIEKMVQLINDGSVEAYLYQMFDSPTVHYVTNVGNMINPDYMPWGIYKFPISLLNPE